MEKKFSRSIDKDARILLITVEYTHRDYYGMIGDRPEKYPRPFCLYSFEQKEHADVLRFYFYFYSSSSARCWSSSLPVSSEELRGRESRIGKFEPGIALLMFLLL